MKAMKRAIPILTLALAACATPTAQRPTVENQAADEETRTQLAMVFDRQMEMSEQLWRVSYRLSAAATELCGDHVAGSPGMVVRTASSFGEKLRPAALARYPALGDAPTVVYVTAGSGAEAAGMQNNDVVTAVNGQPVPPTGKALELYAKLVRAGSSGPILFSVQRSGEAREVTVEPRPVCNYPVVMVDKPLINASADGKGIYVYRGMMDFVRSDEELALVLGHEMAHDFRGHLDAKRKNAMVGTAVGAVFDVLLAAGTGVAGSTFSRMGGNLTAGAYSQEFEAEADYVGLYVMARAGYRIDDAANFWRRMAIGSPGSVTMTSDHPATPERFVALQAAVKEIGAKSARGEPLVPNEMASAASAQSPATSGAVSTSLAPRP
jgi:peptidase M48-like protein/PDZ domain-containing protein